jgi:hypothetical protein
MNNPLKPELDYFIAHQTELVRKYKGKFLVIKDKKVRDAFDTIQEAYFGGQKKFKLGTFMIQHCVPGPEAYTIHFHSYNAVFS